MQATGTLSRSLKIARGMDRVWVVILLIPVLLAAFAPDQLIPTVEFTSKAFLKTSIFIGIAVCMTAWLRAASLEAIVARVFSNQKYVMIVLAALVGGLSPFCSCEVIPFIAALLAAGAPLSPVMAFWLSSPLIDPPMFLITGSVLGFDFAIAKTIAAVGIGLLGGFAIVLIEELGFLKDPLRKNAPMAGCCGSNPFERPIVWKFWGESERREMFRETAVENALFLSKWLLLAYLLQSLMVAWIPAEWVAGTLGGEGVVSIVLGAAIGIPAYLNGYAAVPLVDGLLNQGMAQGTAMAFLIAGGITSVPAALAVWALTRKTVFAWYMVLACAGAILAGFLWNIVA